MNTTNATTSKEKFGRWAMAAALAASLGIGIAAPAAAQYPRVQAAPAAVGSQVWHTDGWAYVRTARGWARTEWQRVFPQRNNAQLVDIYRSGRWVQRVDTSQPGWIFELRADVRAPLSWVKYPANRPISPATTYYLLNNQQWVTLPQMQALAASSGQRPLYAGQEGTIGGFGTGSSAPSSPLSASRLGGPTTASQRTQLEQNLHAIQAASQQRGIDVWLAPSCDPHHMRCQ